MVMICFIWEDGIVRGLSFMCSVCYILSLFVVSLSTPNVSSRGFLCVLLFISRCLEASTFCGFYLSPFCMSHLYLFCVYPPVLHSHHNNNNAIYPQWNSFFSLPFNFISFLNYYCLLSRFVSTLFRRRRFSFAIRFLRLVGFGCCQDRNDKKCVYGNGWVDNKAKLNVK